MSVQFFHTDWNHFYHQSTSALTNWSWPIWQIQNLRDPGPVVYALSKGPPLSEVIDFSQDHQAVVPQYSHQVYYVKFTLVLLLNLIPSRVSQSLEVKYPRNIDRLWLFCFHITNYWRLNDHRKLWNNIINFNLCGDYYTTLLSSFIVCHFILLRIIVYMIRIHIHYTNYTIHRLV